MSEMKNDPVVGVTDAGLIAALRKDSAYLKTMFGVGHVYQDEAADRLEALTQPSGKVSGRPERVQAAFDVWRERQETGPNATALFEYIEALEAVQLPARPVVKPLNWGKTSYGRPEVATVVGVYRVHEHVSGGWGATFRSTCLVDQYGRQNFATEAGAIAACEADYERRILSALEGVGHE